MQRADSPFRSVRCLQFFSNFRSNWNDSKFGRGTVCSLAPENRLSLRSNAQLIANLHSINLNGKPDLPFPVSYPIQSQLCSQGWRGSRSTAAVILKADLNFVKYSTSGRIGGFSGHFLYFPFLLSAWCPKCLLCLVESISLGGYMHYTVFFPALLPHGNSRWVPRDTLKETKGSN